MALEHRQTLKKQTVAQWRQKTESRPKGKTINIHAKHSCQAIASPSANTFSLLLTTYTDFAVGVRGAHSTVQLHFLVYIFVHEKQVRIRFSQDN